MAFVVVIATNEGKAREDVAITTRLLRLVQDGVIAGLVGTIAMTPPILIARRLRLFATPPPAQITANLSRRTAVLPEPDAPVFPLVWAGAHLAYGAGAGIVFAVSRRWLPRRVVAAGLLFGGGVWAISYLGYVPALRLYPEPADDARPRQVVMIAAHGIFGVALSETFDRREKRRH